MTFDTAVLDPRAAATSVPETRLLALMRRIVTHILFSARICRKLYPFMGPAHKKTRKLHNRTRLSALIIPFFAPPCRPPHRRRAPKRPKRPDRRHAAHDVKSLIIIGRQRPPHTCGPQAHRPANSLLRVGSSHLRRHHTTAPTQRQPLPRHGISAVPPHHNRSRRIAILAPIAVVGANNHSPVHSPQYDAPVYGRTIIRPYAASWVITLPSRARHASPKPCQ